MNRCLDAIFAQDYPGDRYRVWVVDAGSDGRHGAGGARARGGRPPARARERPRAAQRRSGLQPGHPAGPLRARSPGWTPTPTSIRTTCAGPPSCSTEEGPAVCCVGAQPEQVGETPFGEAVALARGSSFGVESSVYADKRVRADVDTIQAGVYRRGPLEEVGGFRTDMLVGEDEELNWRLKKAGYQLSSTPACASSTRRAPRGRRLPPAPELRPVARPRAGRPPRLPEAVPPGPSRAGGHARGARAGRAVQPARPPRAARPGRRVRRPGPRRPRSRPRARGPS